MAAKSLLREDPSVDPGCRPNWHLQSRRRIEHNHGQLASGLLTFLSSEGSTRPIEGNKQRRHYSPPKNFAQGLHPTADILPRGKKCPQFSKESETFPKGEKPISRSGNATPKSFSLPTASEIMAKSNGGSGNPSRASSAPREEVQLHSGNVTPKLSTETLGQTGVSSRGASAPPLPPTTRQRPAIATQTVGRTTARRHSAR